MTKYCELKPRIISFISENKLIQINDKVVIAVSGGVDSMLLLHILNDLRRELKIEIAIGHINHNIRSNSKEDEEFVRDQAIRLNIPFIVKRLDFTKKEKTENIEAWARAGRYEQLEIIRKGLNYNKIATAHNSNDQIETILQRLSEKSGICGLRGIHKKIGYIIRPLLEIPRKDIENVINELNIDHIEDQTNRDIELTRNHFRHKIIPNWEKLYPNLGGAFQTVSNTAQDNITVLNYFFKELENMIVKKDESSFGLTIDIKHTNKLPLAVLTSFFGYLISTNNWRKHNWNELKRIILNAKIGKIYHLGGYDILKDRNEWLFRPKLGVTQKPVKIEIGESVKFGNYSINIRIVKDILMSSDPNREYIDKKKVQNKNLVIRYWKVGDVFRPLGLNGTKKISDYLTNSKINTFKKREQPVLTADDEIIWLCGHRLSEKVKIDDKTKQYLELSIR